MVVQEDVLACLELHYSTSVMCSPSSGRASADYLQLQSIQITTCPYPAWWGSLGLSPDARCRACRLHVRGNGSILCPRMDWHLDTDWNKQLFGNKFNISVKTECVMLPSMQVNEWSVSQREPITLFTSTCTVRSQNTDTDGFTPCCSSLDH